MLVSYWSILIILVSYWSIFIILVSYWSILLILVLVQISCWTPYSVLCLWTTILPPETLNVYFTLIPSIACKVRIVMFFVQNHFIISSAITSSECHGCLVEPSEVDKIMSICCIQPINCVFNRVTAGYFYLKRGKTGPMPAELFDYKYVLIILIN